MKTARLVLVISAILFLLALCISGCAAIGGAIAALTGGGGSPALIFSMLMPAELAQPVDLTGRVVDKNTGQPLADARILLWGNMATTNTSGDFAIRAYYDEPAITCSKLGYQVARVAINLKEPQPVKIQLEPSTGGGGYAGGIGNGNDFFHLKINDEWRYYFSPIAKARKEPFNKADTDSSRAKITGNEEIRAVTTLVYEIGRERRDEAGTFDPIEKWYLTQNPSGLFIHAKAYPEIYQGQEIYSEPLQFLKYPINLGDSWQQTVTVTHPVSGSYLLEMKVAIDPNKETAYFMYHFGDPSNPSAVLDCYKITYVFKTPLKQWTESLWVDPAVGFVKRECAYGYDDASPEIIQEILTAVGLQ